MASDRISARLACLLIDTMVPVGRECAALPSLEIHHVVADSPAAKIACRLMCLPEQGESDAERRIRFFRSGDRLEDEIDGCALFEGGQLRRDMCKDAALGGDGVALAHGIDKPEQPSGACDVVSRGIDANHTVA